MAFSMNNMSSAFGANSGNVTIHQGDGVPEIPEIVTEEIGFKGLNGDKKARIMKESWPENDLPPSYASLLSVASARGLYAAASPTALLIGKTDRVRTLIYSEDKTQDIVDCDPIQTFPHQRLTHVAFASDEACLVVAEQASPQIVAYDVKGLVAGDTNLKVALSTNAPVRTVAPNPDPSQAHLFALLNTDGQLLLANLQGNAELVSGANGPVLAEGVACLAWSTKGKQILAGKADGTAIQVKPDGTVVASIPKPESVPKDCHLAQIVWTETDVFICIYTPSNVPEGDIPESHYFVVKTNKARSEFTFRKTSMDLVFPTVARYPIYFHTARLRDYGPGLDELVCVTATVSADVKAIAKSKKPLSGETSEENAYVVAIPDNESLLATMPVKADASGDTTAIGMAIDLSDSEPIILPILSNPEVAKSEGPLPLLLALSNEGILRVWAVVYNEAITQNMPYPGFADVMRVRETIGVVPSVEEEMDTADQQLSTMETQAAPTTIPTAPAIQSPSANAASPFNRQGSSFASSDFGAGGTFSKPTPIGGETKSSWTSTGFTSTSQSSTSTFGTTGFGQTPTLGSNTASTFGKPGTIGAPSLQSAASPAFGKSSFGATAQSSSFASAGNSSSSPFANAGSKPISGFSSFANQSGFNSAKTDAKTESPFGKFSSGSGFATASGSNSFFSGASKSSNAFSQTPASTTFGKPSPIGGSNAPAASPFGIAGKSAFKLDSTFHKDETSKDEDSKPGDSDFGFSGFGSMLGGGQKQPAPVADKETEMEDDEDEAAQMKPPKVPQETPPSTLNQPKTTTTPHVASLFGSQQQQTTTPPTQQKPATSWSFGAIPSTTPKDTPAPNKFIFATKPVTDTTPALVAHSEPNRAFAPISNVPKSSDSSGNKGSNNAPSSTKMPEAPLPPDPFSKPGYQTGDTSASSINSKGSREADEAPLPPDFVAAGRSAVQSTEAEDSGLPTDGSSSDLGDSGDDLTGEGSAGEEDAESEHSDEEEEADEEVENIQTSPESSFGHAADQSPVASPTGGPFTKISKGEQLKPAKTLFGELGKSGPIFAPPKPQPQQSPRSPSPVRKSASSDLFQSTSRSVSAPAVGQAFLQQKKMEHQKSPFAMQAAKARDEEAAKEAARAEVARKAREEAEAREMEPLVDDEDAIIRQSLARDPEPQPDLDPFITIQPVKALQDLSHGRSDIHSQIEILYEDINSMVNTLGINARSLQEYMIYQNRADNGEVWLDVLSSDTPMDVVNEELFLSNINSLSAGCTVLGGELENLDIQHMEEKLDQCQFLLTQELTDLRARIIAMRRSSQARAQSDNNENAPLTAEQSSIQQDLRKASSTVLTSLVQCEESLVTLRAKLADLAPLSSSHTKSNMFGLGQASQKKPSVEAVLNTVTKMTAMAERKSADVDVLEAQMRKLNMSSRETERPSTPERRISRRTPTTPGSGVSSVYLTPESKGARSVRSTPSRNQQLVVSVEDREKWQAKARRRKNIATTLKAVLQAKQENAA